MDYKMRILLTENQPRQANFDTVAELASTSWLRQAGFDKLSHHSHYSHHIRRES
jgi:hypothetical protein